MEEKPGYIPIFRKFFNHYLWEEDREFSKAEAWIDCIQMARYKKEKKKKMVAGNIVEWGYGQFPASIRFLKKRWNWGSNTKVESFLKLLESDNMISIEKGQGQNVITLCNYNSYDLENYHNKTQKGLEEDRQRTQKGQNSKKGKKDKKEKNIPSPKFGEGEYAYKLSEFLLKKVLEHQPTHQFSNNPPNLQDWATEADRMHRIDKRDYKEAAQIVKWVFDISESKEDFDWRDNVQSTKKLRKHYDRLKSDMSKTRSGKLLTHTEMINDMEKRGLKTTDGNYVAVEQGEGKKPKWRYTGG